MEDKSKRTTTDKITALLELDLEARCSCVQTRGDYTYRFTPPTHNKESSQRQVLEPSQQSPRRRRWLRSSCRYYRKRSTRICHRFPIFRFYGSSDKEVLFCGRLPEPWNAGRGSTYRTVDSLRRNTEYITRIVLLITVYEAADRNEIYLLESYPCLLYSIPL